LKLEKRLTALEAKLIAEPVILVFADGITEKITGPRYFLLDLFRASLQGAPDLSPVQAEQLDLIHRSVSAQEPGGGHMIELIRLSMDWRTQNDGATDDSASF
jgi:hypothetical protein